MSETEAASASPYDRFNVVRASGSPDWPAIWLPRPQRRVERGNPARALRLVGMLVPDSPPSALVGA